MLPRKIKILENIFLIDRDRKNIKLNLSGTSPAGFVKNTQNDSSVTRWPQRSC